MSEPGLVWIAIGLLLMVLEVVLPGAFLLWLGLAAVGAGLASRITPLGFDSQVIVFAVLAPVSIAAAIMLRRRTKATQVNTPGSGLIGRAATALAFDGREGRVRLGDSDWPARLMPGELPPAPNARLDIVAVDGMVLLVRPQQITQP